jgi:hypothetical protein
MIVDLKVYLSDLDRNPGQSPKLFMNPNGQLYLRIGIYNTELTVFLNRAERILLFGLHFPPAFVFLSFFPFYLSYSSFPFSFLLLF